jgi:hypothetical protein
MRNELLAFAACATLSAPAVACVEAAGNGIGNIIKNECVKPVWIAWCAGSGCRPNGDTAVFVNAGHFIPAGNGPINFLYCVAPKKMDSDGACK